MLFLDEPSAGVDVELRRDMWQMVRELRDTGVTIILTTHYIEEAEEMADRIGVISKGEIVLVEDKVELMRKLGKKQLTLHLQTPLQRGARRSSVGLCTEPCRSDGNELTYTYDTQGAGWWHRRVHAAAWVLAGIPVQGPADHAEFAGGHLCEPGEERAMNWHAVRAIYGFEMARTRCARLLQSIVSPVVSTSLYFVVFGAAIGSRIPEVGGVSYGAFIVPGLVMLSLLTQSVSNASFGIYFPRFSGTIYELLSAPVSYLEIVLSYVGAAATKSIVLGLIILAHGGPVRAACRSSTRFWMLLFLVLDLGHLQPHRLHPRHLGRWIREAAGGAFADHHAADLSGGQLLLDRHAAAVLADRGALQSRGLPDQRLSAGASMGWPMSASASAW